jgi:glycosyltransferase involved in cell wall biosynthesis
MLNFSVALIARNEEKTLPRLIGSLTEFMERGGNVLVLDTGSTDSTANVARDLGCMVVEVGDKFRITIDKELADKINEKFIVGNEAPVVKEGESLFDFASARNYIADFAATDVIATPDCDEIFTKFDIDKIEEVIKNGAEQLEYQFVFSHDDAGNPLIKFMHCKFYNRKKLHWEGIIHEILVGEAQKVYLDENIIKLEHYQNEKTNRTGYLKGLAIDCYQNPENDRNSHYFAREMMYCGRFKSAIKEFERHVAMNRWPAEASQSMLFIGDCYKYLGKVDEMFKWYSLSISKELRREPLMKLAEYYFSKNMHHQVIAYCKAALTIKQIPFYSNYQPYYENVPHELLYISYWWIGEKVESEYHHREALRYCPTHPKYLEDAKFYDPKISFVIPTLDRPEGLTRCLESIKKLNYPQDKIEIIIKRDSFENRTGVPKLLKQGVEESTGDWVVFAANDTEFTPDSIREALKVGSGGFVSFNTGELYPDGGNINEHFMIRKDIIKIIGEVFDTEFNHCGVDNLLWAKMKKLGIALRAEKAHVTHYHFAQTGGPMDKVYELAYSKREEDRALLAKKLKELL